MNRSVSSLAGVGVADEVIVVTRSVIRLLVRVAVAARSVALDVLTTLPSPTIVEVTPLTVPVKVGLARLAFRLSAVVVNAVVAIRVVLLPAVCVGAVGVPVKPGEAKLAFKFRAVC